MLFTSEVTPVNAVDNGNHNDDGNEGCEPGHDLGDDGILAESHFAGQPQADLGTAGTKYFEQTLFEKEKQGDQHKTDDQFRD